MRACSARMAALINLPASTILFSSFNLPIVRRNEPAISASFKPIAVSVADLIPFEAEQAAPVET